MSAGAKGSTAVVVVHDLLVMTSAADPYSGLCFGRVQSRRIESFGRLDAWVRVASSCFQAIPNEDPGVWSLVVLFVFGGRPGLTACRANSEQWAASKCSPLKARAL